MPKESYFTGSNNPLCQETSLWETRDEQSAEKEVSDFLYALVRLLKPRVVVETGCWKGDSTIAIAKAVKENGRGELFSCDIDEGLVKETNDWLAREGLKASVCRKRGADLIKSFGEDKIDLAFIDSGKSEVRREEIELVIPRLKTFGCLVLHDTAPQHTEVCRLAGEIRLPGIYLNTPRGLSLYIKN